jgi:hypothetical protein
MISQLAWDEYLTWTIWDEWSLTLDNLRWMICHLYYLIRMISLLSYLRWMIFHLYYLRRKISPLLPNKNVLSPILFEMNDLSPILSEMMIPPASIIRFLSSGSVGQWSRVSRLALQQFHYEQSAPRLIFTTQKNLAKSTLIGSVIHSTCLQILFLTNNGLYRLTTFGNFNAVLKNRILAENINC